MPAYRLYLLNAGGHFRTAITIAGPTDAAALREAELKREGCAAELWCSSRKIKRFATGMIPPGMLPDRAEAVEFAY